MTTQTLPAFLTALAASIAITTVPARAGEVGHFAPAVPNLRDFIVPEPGFYGVLYNYSYSSDRLNDAGGNAIRSITLNPLGGPGITVNLDIDVDLYAVAPAFIWVSNTPILGARYGAFINPTFANSTVGASLTTHRYGGTEIDSSQFDIGDLFVQPVWLGWSGQHHDLAFGYGFHAPIGRYEALTIGLPTGGTLRTTAPDNIGLGFWTHQLQGNATWYPWEHKATALSATLTYEIHHKKEGFDLTPGHNLTLNWGASQFLPLRKDESLLLEIGPGGYSSWQVTDDSGRDAAVPHVHDEVHGVGGQIGLAYLPWDTSVNFRGFYEFYARDRFQGWSIGLNIGKKF